MKNTNRICRAALIALTFLAASCGGGSGGGGASDIPNPAPPPPPPPSSGIEGSGISIGPITGFGSVIVNGVHFETTGAVFSVDDNPGSQDDLSVGQVVTVIGTIDDDGLNGTAAEVRFNDNVEGPVDNVNPAAGTMTVLGQAVRITANTIFDNSIVPPDLSGLSPGDVVEVSGLTDASDDVVASYIERRPAGGEFEVTGPVSAHDGTTMTFMINALAVDYSAAMLEDFADGAPANGDLVEARGSGFGPGGALVATRVERKDDDQVSGEPGDELEIEGYITRYVSAADFDVSGRPASTSAATVYEGGTATDLALNLRVEVKGTLDDAGVLVARKIQFETEAEFEIQATVDAVDTTAATLSLLGITIATRQDTSFEDDSDIELRNFGLAQINPGDFVEIKAFAGTDGDLVAARVRRDDPEDEVELQGIAESVAEPTLRVLGVNIVTFPATEYEGSDQQPLTAAEFFARAPGMPVKAKGTWDGTTLSATELQFED